MELEPDIVERIRRDFGEDYEQALEMLREYGKAGRVARCIVVASCGSLKLLRAHIDGAKLDYRDAIMAGEYDSARRQIRDLRVSFLLDSPETLWLGAVTYMMASRGYTLAWLESRAATALSPAYATDRFEGRAKFEGAEGVIELEKKDCCWSIHGDLAELSRFKMNRVFDNHREFCDAVSGFILTRRRPLA